MSTFEGPAKSRAQAFWGICFLFGTLTVFCVSGGGSRGGGVVRPLGTTVPWGVSPKEGRAAHGPRHPALKYPLETLFISWLALCLAFGLGGGVSV